MAIPIEDLINNYSLWTNFATDKNIVAEVRFHDGDLKFGKANAFPIFIHH